MEEEIYSEDRAKMIWDMYQNGVNYQNDKGYRDNFPRYVDYFQGKQWGEVEAGTEQMPRMVENIIKLICRTKKSNIMSRPCRVVFKNEKNSELATKLTRYFAWWQKKIKFNEIDDNALDDGCILGTYVYHEYWDNDKDTTQVELIDPLDLVVANPLEENIQEQKWVLIASREDIEDVKAMADKGVDVDLIVESSNEDNAYQDIEQKDTKLCTVLTRYFKRDGAVYCERATQNLMINEEFPLTPTIEGEDGESITYGVASEYPIIVGSYERRRKSIYGLGEVESLIANQQGINNIYSMQAYNVMLNAWRKWKVSPDALNGQEITNEIGEVLTDYSKDGNGIQQIQEAGFSDAPSRVANELVTMTRVMSGANEVINGDYFKAGISGAAIAQMQAQATIPTENLMYRHWRVIEQVARVWLQMERLNLVDDIEFTYLDDNKETKSDIFNGSEIGDAEFDIVAESSGGTHSSTAGDIQFLEALVGLKILNGMQFIELYPSDAVSNKDDVKKMVEEQRHTELEQAMAKIEQCEQQMLQATQLIERQTKVIDNIMPTIQENNTLKVKLAELQKEYTDKLNIAQSDLDTVSQDAQEFAMELNKHMNNGNNTQEIAKTSMI